MKFIPVVILLLAIFSAESLPLKGGERILFIGNSLTAKLPSTVNELLKANNLPQIDGYRLQIWNQSLETHWTFTPSTHANLMGTGENGYKIKGASTLYKVGQYNESPYTTKGYILALEAIKNGTPDKKPWDYVVLQDYAIGDVENTITKNANGTISTNGRFYKYASMFVEEIRKVGAQPIFYMNWVINPDVVKSGGVTSKYWIDQSTNTVNNYKLLGDALNVPIVPVCAAMNALCTTMKPSDAKSAGWLYNVDDNVHPNDQGKSLQDYSFAAFFSGKAASTMKYFSTPVSATGDKAIKSAVDEMISKYGGKVAIANSAAVTKLSSVSRVNYLFTLGSNNVPKGFSSKMYNLTGQSIHQAKSVPLNDMVPGTYILR